MDDFKQRLQNEAKELNDRKDKLFLFLASDKFASIDPVQKTLLTIQHEAMQTYSRCLTERLTWLGD